MQETPKAFQVFPTRPKRENPPPVPIPVQWPPRTMLARPPGLALGLLFSDPIPWTGTEWMDFMRPILTTPRTTFWQLRTAPIRRTS